MSTSPAILLLRTACHSSHKIDNVDHSDVAVAWANTLASSPLVCQLHFYAISDIDYNLSLSRREQLRLHDPDAMAVSTETLLPCGLDNVLTLESPALADYLVSLSDCRLQLESDWLVAVQVDSTNIRWRPSKNPVAASIAVDVSAAQQVYLERQQVIEPDAVTSSGSVVSLDASHQELARHLQSMLETELQGMDRVLVVMIVVALGLFLVLLWTLWRPTALPRPSSRRSTASRPCETIAVAIDRLSSPLTPPPPSKLSPCAQLEAEWSSQRLHRRQQTSSSSSATKKEALRPLSAPPSPRRSFLQPTLSPQERDEQDTTDSARDERRTTSSFVDDYWGEY